MSIMDTTTVSEAHTSVKYEKAHSLFERAASDPELCRICFARNRRYFPEEAEREAEELRWGATKGVLEAKGHQINEDGSLMVNPATSDPDPSTFREVPPATTIDGEYKPPRATTICECGTIDHPEDNRRALSQIHTCIDNLAEWFGRLDLSTYPDSFNPDAAHDRASLLRRYDNMSAKDEIVLSEALRAGLGS